jgi:hypothetical protein
MTVLVLIGLVLTVVLAVVLVVALGVVAAFGVSRLLDRW